MMAPERGKARVAILISGRGSNMMSLVKAARTPDFPARVAVVISNRPDAAGLRWAAEQGIETDAIDHAAFADRQGFESALDVALTGRDIDLICLAGFMRLLTAKFVDKWMGRMLNIHPSLLPSFRGLNTHQQALDAGVKIAGCTVHFVVPEMDAGPIVAQAAVPVSGHDTADTLADRILEAEHRIYPEALRLVASGNARIESNKVVFQPEINQPDRLFSPRLAGSDK